MKELIAIGSINGDKTIVTCEKNGDKWSFLFNGEENQQLDKKLRELMKTTHRIGNYPPKTMKLNLCAIFDGCEFFDRNYRTVEVLGNIEQIPHKDGVVF